MTRGLRWLYRRLGARYPRVVTVLQLQVGHVVVALGVLLLDLYVAMSRDELWRIFAVTQVLVVIESALAYTVASKLLRPADPWLRGERTARTAVPAWRALAGLPMDFLRYRRSLAVVLNVVPISVYVLVELDAAVWPGFPVLLAGASVVLLYGIFLRFFLLELLMRPVLEEVSCDLPAGIELGRTTAPLKWRLLVSVPAITIISGVTIAGLTAPRDGGLEQLGVGVLVTLAVSFTLSFELSALLLRSILEPIEDLRRGTARVAAGDYSVRVPVLGSDEPGQLAGSFNQMVEGLQERERLREAFGAFVDPVLADRVVKEGTVLEGDEVEVTVLFLDIRDFTAFAERASAREVVQRLNEFYEVVVPVIVRHGGHANKFVGDGLLGVFGAPDRLPDHADRAVAAALDIAAAVQERYGGALRIGIGINSGPVVAGTVGGGGRVEFTVIGDAVNTAARVEEVTRATLDTVLVTEATCALLERDHGGFAARPTVELKGKRERVRLHAPVRAAATVTAAVRNPPAWADDEGAVRPA